MGGHNGVNPAAVSGDPNQRPPYGPNWIATHTIFDLEHDPIVTRCLALGLDNRADNPVQVIFNPAQLDGRDGFFNMPYEEVLAACDVGVFPSWYEPWGYTPQEAAAFAVRRLRRSLRSRGRRQRQALFHASDGEHGRLHAHARFRRHALSDAASARLYEHGQAARRALSSRRVRAQHVVDVASRVRAALFADRRGPLEAERTLRRRDAGKDRSQPLCPARRRRAVRRALPQGAG